MFSISVKGLIGEDHCSALPSPKLLTGSESNSTFRVPRNCRMVVEGATCGLLLSSSSQGSGRFTSSSGHRVIGFCMDATLILRLSYAGVWGSR